MFEGCTSLTSTPELPATTLAESCYRNMFRLCTSLTGVPSNIGSITTVMPNSACCFMFYGCSSLSTAPELPSINLRNRCYQSMFENCTSLVKAPELLTTAPINEAYYNMFYGCSSLNYIKCLATGVTSADCLVWVGSVAASGTFIKHPAMTGWTIGTSGIPTGWTVQDDYVEIGGVKWATMNIGASAITDTGLYFSWGDTQGYTAEQIGSGEGKKYFGWTDYVYGDGTADPTAANMTKYNSTDGLTTLQSSDDGVIAAWGGNWRMPTKEEYIVLRDATNSAYTTNYLGTGVVGTILTDKNDSTKQLFFPAGGFVYNGSRNNYRSTGNCWDSSLNTSTILGGYSMGFSSQHVVWQQSSYRRNGFNLRGILNV